MNVGQLIPRAFLSWYPPWPLGLTLFPSPLPRCSLSFKRRNLMEKFHLQVFSNVCPSLYFVWLGSLYAFPSAEKEASLIKAE